MGEEYGIETLKEASLLLVKFGHKLEDALEDDKVTWTEGISMAISVAPDVFKLVPKVGNLKDEFFDLDDEEMDELVDYIATNLDLDNDFVETAIERGLDVLASINEFRLAIKDAKPVED